MVYVVEIESDGGGRATKEYDASSPYELNFVVSHELRRLPEVPCRGCVAEGQPG
jgi:hypothetical protein